MAGVGQLVDELRVAVEGEDDGLVLREDEVVVLVREAVRVVGVRLELHEVDHVHDAHAHLRQLLAQDGHGVGVSPQQAMTTSGSAPWSLLAHSQMLTPCVQWRTACSMVSHCGRGCLEATMTLI